MGQTLEHGIYLPDEGERNCYSGLAANWQLLDGAVGTVAEHTTALAGKAPAVHTHTKSDITDFPAYGNTAGTICEGNDSRLSDARTPVAHTHGKADITDLLNSNFIPSANNSYDLGSSSYQWNNLYAKNYYYNGVAWGLDQSNEWTGNNTFTRTITTKTNVVRTVAPASDATYGTIFCRDKNNSAIFRMQGTIKTDLSNVWDMMMVAPNQSYQTFFRYAIDATSLNKELRFKADSVIPDINSSDLGTSTNKWKSLNGVNPGALSLPDVTDGDPISTTGWSLTGARNTYTPSENGWFFIRVKGTASTKCSLNIHSGGYAGNYPTWVSVNDPDITLSTSLVVPAQKSVNLYVYIIAAEIEQLIFFPCLGNV